MRRISSTEFVRKPGHFQDEAQREPVVIIKHNHEHAVLLSAAEFHRLKRRDRLVLRAGEISDADIDLIRTATAPDEAAAFDEEVA
jgi:prevent-host-death family protein